MRAWPTGVVIQPPVPVIGMRSEIVGDQIILTNLTTSRAAVATWLWRFEDTANPGVAIATASTIDATFTAPDSGDYVAFLSATTTQGVTITDDSGTLSVSVTVPDVTAPAKLVLTVDSVTASLLTFHWDQHADADGDLFGSRIFLCANTTDVVADILAGTTEVQPTAAQLTDVDLADRTATIDVSGLAADTYWLRSITVDVHNNPADLGDTANYSTAVQVDVPSIVAPPPAPGAFTLSESHTATGVELDWTASSDATQYSPQISTDGGSNWTTMLELNGQTLTYLAAINPQTTYNFRIAAFNQTDITLSNEVSFTSPALSSIISYCPPGFTQKLAFHGDGKHMGATTSGQVVTGTSISWLAAADATLTGGVPRYEVVSDPSAPHGSVLRKNFVVGNTSGGNGIHTLKYGSGGPWKWAYYQIIFRASPNWQNSAGGQKIFYFGPTSGLLSLWYLMWKDSNRLTFRCQVSANNPHRVGGHDEAVFELKGNNILQRGVFNKVDLLFKQQTDRTTSDGAAYIWLNDQPCQSYDANDGNGFYWSALGTGGTTDLESPWGGTKLNTPGMQWFANNVDNQDSLFQVGSGEWHCWWGGNSTTKTVNDYFDLAHMEIWVKA